MPARERDDIVAELSSNIYGAIEERETELGRPLEESECRAILDGYGHPMRVALRFRNERYNFSFGRQLVGPELFPSSVRVLAVNAVATACAAAVLGVIYRVPSWVGLPNILAHLALQVAIVSAIFVSLQWSLDTYPLRWQTTRRNGPKPVTRLESIFVLATIVAWNVWLVSVLRGPLKTTLGGTFEFAPTSSSWLRTGSS